MAGGLPHCRRDRWLDALGEVLLRHADAQPTDLRLQRGSVIRHGHIHRGAVGGVVPGDGTEHHGGVLDAAGQRTNRIQRRSEGDEPVA